MRRHLVWTTHIWTFMYTCSCLRKCWNICLGKCRNIREDSSLANATLEVRRAIVLLITSSILFLCSLLLASLNVVAIQNFLTRLLSVKIVLSWHSLIVVVSCVLACKAFTHFKTTHVFSSRNLVKDWILRQADIPAFLLGNCKSLFWRNS